MAITIQAQLSKKLPIPGTEFSSQQASITISAEVTDLNQVVAEANKLYQLAEQAVDQQLGASENRALPQPSQPPPPRSNPSRPSSASPTYRPAPVTESQLRFLKRLIDQSGSSLAAILHQHQVGSLTDLSCKAAASLIDELKAQGSQT